MGVDNFLLSFNMHNFLQLTVSDDIAMTLGILEGEIRDMVWNMNKCTIKVASTFQSTTYTV